MTHQTRVDRMTVAHNEGKMDWDREWTASDKFKRPATSWVSSVGRQSADLFAEAEMATKSIDRIKLQKLARQAEAEEKVHSRKSSFLSKTMVYNDRNRFRCIGTPLLDKEERDGMLFRSTRRFDDKENRLPTPILDTFHPYESPVKSETVLKRHSIERPAYHAGMHRNWNEMKERAARGDQSARRINVVGYGSKTSIIFSKEAPDKDELRDVAGFSPRPSSRLSTGRLYDHRRPIAKYGKLIYGGRTILVPMTANQPHPQRIFLDTHYNGWVGQAVGSRAPTRHEREVDQKMSLRSGKPPRTVP
ncbi:hypothetical protein GUITHDRAFT_151621 [Guillardia theta CCMP2712]|uniref:Uncharacterized protein n=1 Tax=Guillardia theta (strain CCMP2712) TaxID=905079 RepID=L1JL90_GUITC|nr:hypothetical protein GUITHDRAFT_151621 [Guillardia theta CCMP2712]EKX49102.1 hypothetical protein GUITHDRAFT_151621 [Guillardia theta CCMP2712]|eukprot:XP_005836082.1 hypothetical protein GUITHDRAFT_151621 [Guillardia theta CCMP2712]